MRRYVAVVVVVALGILTPALRASAQPTGLTRYTLSLTIEIMRTKADGRSWDPDGGLPDPRLFATIFFGKMRTDLESCYQTDTFTATCLTGLEIDVNEGMSLAVTVQDKDWVDDDDIGTVSVQLRDPIRARGRWVPMRITGRIKSAVIALTPVERP